MSRDLRREINEFLFEEFGYDSRHSPGRVTETWPFKLTYSGVVKIHGRDAEIYEFTWRKMRFFIPCEDGLVSTTYWHVLDMTIEDFQTVQHGSWWLGPSVDLNTSTLEDERIPRAIERRRVIESLASAIPGFGEQVEILKGLYLPERVCHVGVVRRPGAAEAWVVSNQFAPRRARFLDGGAGYAMEFAVGELINDGTLPQRR